MVYYKIVFGACLLLLLVTYVALAAAQKRRDQRQARVLHFFRLGLSLSAISYLLRVTDAPRVGHPSFIIFVIGFSGTMFLWLGWMEHWRLRAERSNTRLAPLDEEDEPIPDVLLGASLATVSSPLTARAHQVLLHAQYEAHQRRDSCVDTDHLLLGLLCDSGSAGIRILEILGVGLEKVHLELLGQMASCRKFTKPPRQIPETVLRTKTKRLALTAHADQVLALAAHEAHRFDKVSVGTEHLLLGLVLMGKGKAAAVLFGEGVTVDGIRNEIIKAKKAA